jgi:hypothetical protein
MPVEPFAFEEDKGLSNGAIDESLSGEIDVIFTDKDTTSAPKERLPLEKSSGSHPPTFKEGLESIPIDLQEAFARDLHGKIVGIWPLSRSLWRSEPSRKWVSESSAHSENG